MKKSFIFLSIAYALPAISCTTFATFNGSNNAFLMAKNRDNHADRQVIQVVIEPGKYKYIALSREDVPDFVAAGINDHNLAVFNEVTVEYSKEAKGGIADDFSKDILQNYSNAKDVIPDIAKLVAKFPDPVFYQVADGKQILSIEVAPGHKFTYKVVDKGVYSHTNNYLDKTLIKDYPYTAAEIQRLKDSTTRLNRSSNLLKKESAPALLNLQRIALDHTAGANNSILRTGDAANPSSVKSLAFFGVEIDPSGKKPSQINANLYNVGEKYNYVLDQKFWDKYANSYTIIPANSH